MQAGQDPQQRGLAVAVAAHHPDPLAAVDRDRDAVEHRTGREDDTHVLEGDDGGHAAKGMRAGQ